MKRNTLYRLISRLLKNRIDFSERDIRSRIRNNPVRDVSSNRNPNSLFLLGIIYDYYQYHQHFVKAALEMNLSFDVINIHQNDWWAKVNAEDYDGFLVWPNGMRASLNAAYDSRIKHIVDVLHKPVFPEYEAIWLYENKIRGNDWLNANNYPTVPTYIYYDQDDALNHINSHSLPIVMKTNIGASGKGVFIIKSRSEYKKLVKQCFKKGLRSTSGPFAESRGYVFLQDFIPDMEEWRMVRIGDAFFGHEKLQSSKNHKHSGSLLKGWNKPTTEMLNLLYDITEKGSFKSMNVDMFRTKSGSLFVNELHTVFGQSTEHLMIIDGVPGRYIRKQGEWFFEPGSFVSGHSGKARINYFINTILNNSK